MDTKLVNALIKAGEKALEVTTTAATGGAVALGTVGIIDGGIFVADTVKEFRNPTVYKVRQGWHTYKVRVNPLTGKMTKTFGKPINKHAIKVNKEVEIYGK